MKEAAEATTDINGFPEKALTSSKDADDDADSQNNVINEEKADQQFCDIPAN